MYLILKVVPKLPEQLTDSVEPLSAFETLAEAKENTIKIVRDFILFKKGGEYLTSLERTKNQNPTEGLYYTLDSSTTDGFSVSVFDRKSKVEVVCGYIYNSSSEVKVNEFLFKLMVVSTKTRSTQTSFNYNTIKVSSGGASSTNIITNYSKCIEKIKNKEFSLKPIK